MYNNVGQTADYPVGTVALLRIPFRIPTSPQYTTIRFRRSESGLWNAMDVPVRFDAMSVTHIMQLGGVIEKIIQPSDPFGEAFDIVEEVNLPDIQPPVFDLPELEPPPSIELPPDYSLPPVQPSGGFRVSPLMLLAGAAAVGMLLFFRK